MEKTAALLNGFARDCEQDPVVLLETAYAWRSLGSVQGLPIAPNLGDVASAHKSYAQAIQLAERARNSSEKPALILLASL